MATFTTIPDTDLDGNSPATEDVFLALKIVEIIGEDEANQLDPETLYFITNL